MTPLIKQVPGPYDVIYADPPWHYYGDQTKDGAAGKHYPLMTLNSICALPVRRIAAPRSALFLWATGPKLHYALAVLMAWGFNYRGIAYVWVKTRKDGKPIGAQGVTPTFVKPVTELVLVGTTIKKGRPFPIHDLKQRQVVFAPRSVHSVKPDAVRHRIVRLCGDRPRVELFASRRFVGWDAWGLGLEGGR